MGAGRPTESWLREAAQVDLPDPYEDVAGAVDGLGSAEMSVTPHTLPAVLPYRANRGGP